MNFPKRMLWITTLLILTLALLLSCKDGPTNPDPPEETDVTITITPTDGENTLPDATLYDDSTDDQLGTGETDLTREEGTELAVRAEAEGFQVRVQTVTFDTDSDVEIALTEDTPNQVTITYEIRSSDGDLIEGANLFSADTLASAGPEGSINLAYSQETGRFCGRADWHEEDCQEVTLNDDHELDLRPARETVSISITPDIVGYTDRLSNTDSFPRAALDNTVYTLSIGDSTWTDSIEMHDELVDYVSSPYIREDLVTSIMYPAGQGTVDASLHIVYVPKEGHAYSDNHYLNVAEGSMELPTDSDSDVTFPAEHIPACRDGVDNNFSGRMDETEPGCLDTWASTSMEPGSDGFVYEPEDDYETLRVLTRTSGIYAQDKDYFVSGQDGEREIHLLGPSTAISQFKVAVSVESQFTKLVEENQTGEEFALEIHNGPEGDLHTVSTTPIIPDEGADGWTEVTIPLSREYFNNGDDYKFRVIHATKVRGEPTTDGDDDVVIFEKERDDYFIIRAIYEPEELPEAAQKQPAKAVGDVEITDKVVNFH